MAAPVKAPKRKTAPTETEEDSFAEGIIKGLQDFKEGRVTSFKNADELADYLRNLQIVMAFQPITTYYFERKFKKLTKKDSLLKERIIRKLQEVIDNPDIGKPKRHALLGLRSVHIDPFVVAYVIIKDTVLLINFDHHDKVYEETPKIMDVLISDSRTIGALASAGVTQEEYAAFLKSFRKRK